MADIKQAAKWVAQGKDVERASADKTWWLTPWYPLRGTFQVVEAGSVRKSELNCNDLLADDWEIVP